MIFVCDCVYVCVCKDTFVIQRRSRQGKSACACLCVYVCEIVREIERENNKILGEVLYERAKGSEVFSGLRDLEMNLLGAKMRNEMIGNRVERGSITRRKARFAEP